MGLIPKKSILKYMSIIINLQKIYTLSIKVNIYKKNCGSIWPKRCCGVNLKKNQNYFKIQNNKFLQKNIYFTVLYVLITQKKMGHFDPKEVEGLIPKKFKWYFLY